MKELPGPQNCVQWMSSWKVFRAAALMLNIVSLAVLLQYEKHIEKLTMLWPKCWGLIYQAYDKARAEHIGKIGRRFMVDNLKKAIMPPDWSEANPWTACFRALVADEEYWSEQVRHPAAAWMAGGARGIPLAPEEQISMMHVAGGAAVLDVETEEKVDVRKRQSNRDRRIARSKRIRAERDELDALRKQNSHGERKVAEKGMGKGKTKDQAGTPLCFSFAIGSGIKRAHKCQICLSPGHRNADCPKAG